jgi:hypothetical protein
VADLGGGGRTEANNNDTPVPLPTSSIPGSAADNNDTNLSQLTLL